MSDAPMVVPTPRTPTALRIAACLGIAATPSFAAMALITTLLGDDKMVMNCGLDPSSLDGMVPMYLLMSVFHSAPWLKLVSERWGPARKMSSI
jgi:hypothetical protein